MSAAVTDHRHSLPAQVWLVELVRQPPGGVVTVLGDVDVRVGALVELVGLVTVTVLVLVSGGGTAIAVVTVSRWLS